MFLQEPGIKNKIVRRLHPDFREVGMRGIQQVVEFFRNDDARYRENR